MLVKCSHSAYLFVLFSFNFPQRSHWHLHKQEVSRASLLILFIRLVVLETFDRMRINVYKGWAQTTRVRWDCRKDNNLIPSWVLRPLYSIRYPCIKTTVVCPPVNPVIRWSVFLTSDLMRIHHYKGWQRQLALVGAEIDILVGIHPWSLWKTNNLYLTAFESRVIKKWNFQT